MNVTVTTNDSGSVHPLFRGLEKDKMIMKQNVDDYSMNSTYTSVPDPPEDTSLIKSSDSYDYLIITTEEFYNAEAPKDVRDWKTFKDLRDYKRDQGFNAHMITVEDIYSSNDYDGRDNQEKIRNYIKDAYLSWGLDYVLLGGDTGENLIPARYLYYDGGNLGTGVLPSDLYYPLKINMYLKTSYYDILYGPNLSLSYTQLAPYEHQN